MKILISVPLLTTLQVHNGTPSGTPWPTYKNVFKRQVYAYKQVKFFRNFSTSSFACQYKMNYSFHIVFCKCSLCSFTIITCNYPNYIHKDTN